MAMQYIHFLTSKTRKVPQAEEVPILSEEDEKFLSQITSAENPPVLPPRPDLSLTEDALSVKDNAVVSEDNAKDVILCETLPELSEEPAALLETDTTAATTKKKNKHTWSWRRRDSRKLKKDTTTGNQLAEVADKVKNDDTKGHEEDVVAAVEAKKEEEDMALVLERLNLAAVDNRVFSVSDETQKLLRDFNQVLKDLVNGVPTAYTDLEKLLTNGDRQLQKTYNTLPSFLQKLIAKLPDTITKSMAPEIAAAAAERAAKASAETAQNASAAKTGLAAAAAAAKVGLKSLPLKDIVGKPGAIANMLRTIFAYLRARFPAFMGLNVLWSLSLFVLLMVFWYCHKRGREARIAKEADLTEQEVQKLDQEYRDAHPSEDVEPTATATATNDESTQSTQGTQSTAH